MSYKGSVLRGEKYSVIYADIEDKPQAVIDDIAAYEASKEKVKKASKEAK